MDQLLLPLNNIYQEIKMAANWLKKYFKMKPEVTQIFDDLEKYKQFCVDYGYVYDEKHLYNDKTPWGEFDRVQKGKYPKMNWYAKKERTQ